MDELQQQIFLQINLEETRKGLGYQRTMLNRVKGHVDAIDDAALNIAIIAIDEAIKQAVEVAYQLERKAVNRVSPVG